MDALTKNEVKDDFLKAREWIVAHGFDAPNFLAFSVYGEELALIHNISEFYGTPDAPVTEGIYRVWEEATHGAEGTWIPETVYSGSPQLVFVTRLQQQLSPAERQGIWVHAFTHVYQHDHGGMKKSAQLGARMNEIDRTIKFGIDKMRFAYNATQDWKVQSWQDYIAILNLFAASDLKFPALLNEFKDMEDMKDMGQMHGLLVDKYELLKQKPLCLLMAEGTATDVQKQFMQERGEDSIIIKGTPPQYILGCTLSERLREALGTDAWLGMLDTCENDHDYLKEAGKHVDLDAVMQEAKTTFLSNQLSAKPEDLQRMVPNAKKPHPAPRTDTPEIFHECEAYFDTFITEYYNKVKGGAKTVKDVYTKPLEVLYSDTSVYVISSDNYYLSDEELRVMSMFLTKDGEFPDYPHIVRVRRGNFSYVVGMKHVNSNKRLEDIKTPYDLRADNKSWTIHLPVGLVSKANDTKQPNAYAKGIMKALEGKLEPDEIKAVGQAITWIKPDGKNGG